MWKIHNSELGSYTDLITSVDGKDSCYGGLSIGVVSIFTEALPLHLLSVDTPLEK